MATILNSKSYYYNDVNLIAQPAAIKSRKEVPNELHRVIVSPMSAVISEKFAVEADKLGLTICLHRFCKPFEEANILKKLKNNDRHFVCIGLDDDERIHILQQSGASNWLIDTANGYLPQISDVIDKLIQYGANKIMIGNIMSKEGVELYSKYGKLIPDRLYIRVGIAGGSACSTSDTTGFNRGNITELIECSNEANCNNINIVADGGIKNGGYASKAFGAGADYVMMGGYFAKSSEAYTHQSGDGTYWGGASHKQQKLYGGIKRHSEGKVKEIKEKPLPLKDLVDELWGCLSSTVSYSGYKSLSEFISNGIFEQIGRAHV